MLHVGVRVRPFLQNEKDKTQTSVLSINSQHNSLEILEKGVKNDLTPVINQKKFYFQHIYDEKATTSQIFMDLYYPMLEKSLTNSNNVCLFNFGYTGSGKTYTMLHEGGIVTNLYNWLNKSNREIRLSSYEIYQNQVYDLLEQPSNKIKVYSHNQHRKAILCMENNKQQFCLKGLISKKIDSPATLKNLIEHTQSVRRCGVSSRNTQSSRSHAVFQFYCNDKNYSVIDLAGTERAKTSRYLKSNIVEMQQNASINHSLLSLKECIRMMGRKKNHIPFRRCKLTSILRNFFITPSYIIFLSNISPDSSCIKPTLNILNYADILSRLNSPHVVLPKITNSVLPFKNDIFIKPSSAPTSKSRENYKSPLPPRIININFENLPVINDSSKINTVKRGVIRLKKIGINRQHRPLSQNSPRFSPQMINQYNQINKRLETDEKNLFKNYKQDPNLEFMSKLKFILQSKTNIIDTVLYNMEQNNF